MTAGPDPFAHPYSIQKVPVLNKWTGYDNYTLEMGTFCGGGPSTFWSRPAGQKGCPSLIYIKLNDAGREYIKAQIAVRFVDLSGF